MPKGVRSLAESAAIKVIANETQLEHIAVCPDIGMLNAISIKEALDLILNKPISVLIYYKTLFAHHPHLAVKLGDTLTFVMRLAKIDSDIRREEELIYRESLFRSRNPGVMPDDDSKIQHRKTTIGLLRKERELMEAIGCVLPSNEVTRVFSEKMTLYRSLLAENIRLLYISKPCVTA